MYLPSRVKIRVKKKDQNGEKQTQGTQIDVADGERFIECRINTGKDIRLGTPGQDQG
jgi:hypothetical protein